MYTFDHDSTTQMPGTSWSASERRDYRYIGANPNNWVRFNDEDWRIIGVFTVETSSGSKEQLIKIIRNESIGSIPWDSNWSNDWSISTLATLLNSGDYYNRVNTYASTGLNTTARKQIEKIKWYLGGSGTYQNLGGPDYYNFERGELVYEGNSTNTLAKVGLMYPSDYVYTYANGVDDTCYTDGYSCRPYTDHISWLDYYNYQWTLSHAADDYHFVFVTESSTIASQSGGVGNDDCSARPSVYLKSDIKILSGTGTSSNPYTLG